MTARKPEALLFQRLKKYLKNLHFTRIESRTVNGIPDLHLCHKGTAFWMELKADKSKYPKLSKWQISWINNYIKHGGIVIICNRPLSESVLKLYRPTSVFTDPRTLVPEAVISLKDLASSFLVSLLNLIGPR